MCIICNMPVFKEPLADRFLTEFRAAGDRMKAASDAMKVVSEAVENPEDRKRYDALHKTMIRMAHDWNRLEQERERP